MYVCNVCVYVCMCVCMYAKSTSHFIVCVYLPWIQVEVDVGARFELRHVLLSLGGIGVCVCVCVCVHCSVIMSAF